MSPTLPSGAPVVQRQLFSEPTTSRAWWFMGMLVVSRNPEGTPRTPAVVELTIPPGASSPAHAYAELDNAYLVLDGEQVVRSGDEMIVARAGRFVSLPHDVPYSFWVTSTVPVRLLQVHNVDSFLPVVEAAGTPTTELRLPREGEFDTDFERLQRVFEEHGVRFVGPPVDEAEARAFAERDSGASA